MKYLLIICIISVLHGSTLSAQEIEAVNIQNEGLTPPNTLSIPGDRYLDRTEICNVHWLEFLHYAQKDSTKEYYESMLPDTTVWKKFEAPNLIAQSWSLDSTFNNADFTEHYLRYPGYRYFPVVGITYHQATEYCKWRSAAVNITKNEALAKAKKNYRVKYTYVLARMADLEYASREFSGKHTMDRKTSKRIKTMVPDFNRKQEFWNACVRQTVGKTSSGKQVYVQGFNFIGYVFDNGNQWNFYNTFGNVSEITDEEGRSFGGAWIHSMEEITRHKIFFYTQPEYWLGFRCACTVEIIHP